MVHKSPLMNSLCVQGALLKKAHKHPPEGSACCSWSKLISDLQNHSSIKRHKKMLKVKKNDGRISINLKLQLLSAASGLTSESLQGFNTTLGEKSSKGSHSWILVSMREGIKSSELCLSKVISFKTNELKLFPGALTHTPHFSKARLC